MWRQEDQKFKASFGYVLNLKPAWATWDPPSKANEEAGGQALASLTHHPINHHRFALCVMKATTGYWVSKVRMGDGREWMGQEGEACKSQKIFRAPGAAPWRAAAEPLPTEDSNDGEGLKGCCCSVCFCGDTHTHMCAYMHMKVSRQPQVSFLRYLPLLFLDGFSLAWSSPSRLGWLGSKPQGSPVSTSFVLWLQARTTTLCFFYMGAKRCYAGPCKHFAV